ncbi:MAG TPA: hypothetical protein VGX28_02955 [Frankiaceae bacterium]|jgi:hypothetical protein|nr:hypothetical protein [Frankiaceae bacterium]
MSRAARGVLGGAFGVALVALSLLVAYAFGGGWVGYVWLPTPLNVVGSLAIVWAAVHASYVLAVPRERRTPFTRPSRAMTALGALLWAAVLLAVLLQR